MNRPSIHKIFCRSLGAWAFVFLISPTPSRLQAAALVYNTPAYYCPSETIFTVTEQTTAYNQLTSSSVALGACGVNLNMVDQTHYAAIEPGDWQNGAGCGACAVLNYSSHATTVMIIDKCATCGTGTHHLDLSAVAYGELVGSPGCAVNGSGGSVATGGCPAAPGANQVTWHFIQCPLSGSANIKFNNSSGNITYAFKDGSSNGWHPILFWDMLFPIKSVAVGTTATSFTNIARDTSDSIPQFWGGTGASNPTPPLYYQVTDDRNNSVTIGPINSVSPMLAANNGSFVAYGQSSVQLPGCVVGPTNTFTRTFTFTQTPTVGSPTNTPTRTFTVTPTKTNTPLAGCKYIYYDGETAATNLASGSNFATNATLTESTTTPHAGTNSMQIAYNWPAGSYFGGIGWNWAKYNAASARILNLNNFTTLEFYIRASVGAPVTNMTITLADYGGGGSGGVTASTPVTLSNYLPGGVTSAWQVVDIPLSAFNTGGASWDKTKVGEIDFSTGIGQTSGTQTVFIDDFGFYGTCPTNTPTPTNTPIPPTNTFTPTLTRTFTFTNTFTPVPPTNTFTSTNTLTKTFTPTNTNTPLPPTNTFTSTSTRTNTLTFTNTPVPPTNTFTFTSTRTFTSTNTSTPVPPTNTFTSTATRTNSFTSTNTPVPPTNTFTLTRTYTPSFTNTSTPVPPTNTFTSTKTNTPANTFTSTLTPTGTVPFTHTFTSTSTRTNTATSTNTPIPPTNTFTSTKTNTPPPTNTFTSTNTPIPPTSTLTSTKTNTPANTFTPTLTPTGTVPFTNTFTSTFTRTYTGTSTNTPIPPTNTFTSTKTNTPVPSTNTFTPVAATASFTSTKTNTPTFTWTPTLTFTGTVPPTNTATSTATPVVVAVSNGPSAPGNSSHLAGTSNLPMLQFQLNNPGSSAVNMSAITFHASGTGNDLTGVASVNFYLDSNSDGIVDGADALLGTATFNADNGTASILFTNSIPPGTANTYLVTYNLSSSAVNGSYSLGFADNFDLTGTIAGGEVQFSGLPLTSSVLTLVSATATATFTSTHTLTKTSTPTATSTNTPVYTSTHTLTPTPTRGVVGEPYPNPSQGGPIHVDVQLRGYSKVKFGVFTAAFRKIFETSFYAATNQTVDWDLKDKTGAAAASGLYYLRLEVDEASGTTVKIKKVLVIR